MGVEASIELGWQLLPLEELSSNVHFRVALHFGDVMDAVSDLLTDELPNSLVDGQTHTGSLQSQLHSYVQTSQIFHVAPGMPARRAISFTSVDYLLHRYTIYP